MVADREAGTPGPWAYRPDKYDDWGVVKAGRFVLCRVRDPEALSEAVLSAHRDKGTDPWEANARRIARLPDLEAAYLTLAAENATLRVDNHIATIQRAEVVERLMDDIATLRASEAAALDRVKVLEGVLQNEVKRSRRHLSSSTIAALTPTADKE